MNVAFLRTWVVRMLVVMSLATSAWSATFGKVVPISGAASDIALDEGRGVLYIADFTNSTIDVMSLASNSIQTSFNVPPQPGSLALSPDGNYLVIAHYAPYTAPSTPVNALTVINLSAGNARQTFSLGFPPLGVAFTIDGFALIATTTNFIRFDPVTGGTQVIGTVADVAGKTLPVPLATFPPTIISASMNVSADGLHVYGLTDTITFAYDVSPNPAVRPQGYTASPPLGPRVVSVSDDGSYYLTGWVLQNPAGTFIEQFPSAAGLLNIGGHAIDSRSNTIYAQIPTANASTANATLGGQPLLGIYDADNLTLRQQIQLPENLAGKSVLTAARDVMYSISDSGVLILPVGRLNRTPRVQAAVEDIVFRGNFCNRSVATQQLVITDPGGGSTDFSLSTSTPGINISPSAGTTPATVTVSVDPNTFANQLGTTVASIQIQSNAAVNVPPPVRVLINSMNPDQRGAFIDLPGTLVDILSDPVRNRYYVLRQDKNQVLVFDSTSNQQTATLRTNNVPTGMAITFDGTRLLIGADDSQIIYVYNLNSLQAELPIVMPFGHYPRSIASSGNATLVAVRSAAGPNTIDRVDIPSRTATTLPTLGVFQNSVNVNTVLAAAPNGGSILAASADGNVMLYDANSDTFGVSRKDFTALAGTFAASSFGQYVVDNNLLNSSLVATAKLDSSVGASSGFAFVDQVAYRTTSPALVQPGNVQRVNLANGIVQAPTRLVESPLTGNGGFAFVRTLAALADRSNFVALTISGVTVLPFNYAAPVPPPNITRVVNSADQTSPVAPGGLITVFGTNLSPVNIATSEIPLPTALANSCLVVNGVPMPIIFVSNTTINAQLPFNVDGSATLTLRTPGGTSDNYLLNILPAAPSVFRTGTAGPQTGLATITRDDNGQLITPTNPINPGDTVTILLTGLGATNPGSTAGIPSSQPTPVLVSPTVTLGGAPMGVIFAGLVPGAIGVYQIDVLVPRQIPSGLTVPLVISSPGGSATEIDVRVVK